MKKVNKKYSRNPGLWSKNCILLYFYHMIEKFRIYILPLEPSSIFAVEYPGTSQITQRSINSYGLGSFVVSTVPIATSTSIPKNFFTIVSTQLDFPQKEDETQIKAIILGGTCATFPDHKHVELLRVVVRIKLG